MLLYSRRSVLLVSVGHLKHFPLPLCHPLLEIASVFDLSELQREHECELLLEPLMLDSPCALTDCIKCILPEGLPDGKGKGIRAALSRLHELVPLGQNVAQL